MHLYFRLFAISVQLSPVEQSSGIQVLETDTFKLCCNQTLTGNNEHDEGVQFIVMYIFNNMIRQMS